MTAPNISFRTGFSPKAFGTIFSRRRSSPNKRSISGVRNLHLSTDCASRLLYLPRLGCSLLVVRIYEYAETAALGTTRSASPAAPPPARWLTD
jgi:hypothetical protein